MLFTDQFKTVWTILLGTIILMLVCFYNGYPLVFSDTGTYIQSGFEYFVPLDRPLTYGLFLAFSSLAFSPWLTILLQCFCLAYVLFHLFRLVFLDQRRRDQAYLISLLFLVGTTSVSWSAALLMPDIFMTIGMISLVLILLDQEASIGQLASYSIILLLSGSVHFSHLLIMSLILLSLSLYYWWNKHKSRTPYWASKKLVLAWSLNIISWLLVPSIHYFAEGRFQTSKASHVFLVGRLLDMGLLQKVLDDHCATENYQLCKYKDQLPQNSRKLHWDPSSPIYKEGGWEATKADYNKIIWKSVSRPQYLLKHFFEASKATAIQLCQIGIGNDLKTDWYGQPESPPYQQIAKRFPGEFKQYTQSRQNTNLWKQSLDFDSLNIIFSCLLGCCLILLILVWTSSFKQHISALQWGITCIFLLSIFFNALVTANLSVVAERFQSRIIWIIPLLTILLILGNLSKWRTLFQVPENKFK